MRAILSFFFGRLFPLFYNPLIKLLAYGPWGTRFHHFLIRVYRKLYGISDSSYGHSRLGDFFLRDRAGILIEQSPLVCPAESRLLAGPEHFHLSDSIRIKGLVYNFFSFKELQFGNQGGGTFWNFYLMPKHYHYVHAPADGSDLRILKASGASLPVNSLGRWLSPTLYMENERLTFSYQSEVFGRVNVICIGALGVSGLRSLISPDRKDLKKGEKILAFEMGSSVLLTVERLPNPPRIFSDLPLEMKVGEVLCFL